MAIDTVSNLAESFLYVYLGLTALTVQELEKETTSNTNAFIFSVLGLTFVARILTVIIPMTFLKIFNGRKFNIKCNEIVIIMIGGMIRGPIAFALSL